MSHTPQWKWYVVAAVLFGAAMALALFPSLPGGVYREWFFFMALAIVAELTPVNLPDTGKQGVVSLGFAVVLASLLSLGPSGALFTAGAAGVVVLFTQRSALNSTFLRRILGMGIIVASTACAAWVYQMVGGSVEMNHGHLSWRTVVLALSTGGAMAATNVGLVVLGRMLLGFR
ncbi:MAG: hypothetical protein ACM3TT_11455, partial [Syntrophothermus sp.]